MAQSWDPQLIQEVGALIGAEARYVAHSRAHGHHKLLVMAPNADLARDPRWGRTEECYGEDAFFNGTLAVALVRGALWSRATPFAFGSGALRPIFSWRRALRWRDLREASLAYAHRITYSICLSWTIDEGRWTMR
jgi:hypothetical protein